MWPSARLCPMTSDASGRRWHCDKSSMWYRDGDCAVVTLANAIAGLYRYLLGHRKEAD